MPEKGFSWVQTHKELTAYLATKENDQTELIGLLESVGISPFNDKSKEGSDYDIKLDEIDPFTFFCYINKYGSKRRTKKLQRIAEKLGLSIPEDDYGIPSAQAQRVWFFPFQYLRQNSEIKRLWRFFRNARADQLTNEDFEDVLKIRNVGRTKLTESLFYILPDQYLPINGPTIPYLTEVLDIDTDFNTYEEYEEILAQVKSKTDLPFYELSYEAWNWSNQRKTTNYWIFQGNPKVYDYITALQKGELSEWTVSAHKDKIKEGDQVILWITGEEAGCYGLAEVVEEPELNHYDQNIKIEITYNLSDEPVLRDEFLSDENLTLPLPDNAEDYVSCTKEEYDQIRDLIEDQNEFETIKSKFPSEDFSLDYCQLFLSHSISFHYKDELKLFAFLLPMEYVFEDFIFGFIDRELDEIAARAQRRDVYLDEDRIFNLQPDLYLMTPRGSLIADTKYKIVYSDESDPKKGISQNDLYQMVAYAIRFGVNEVVLFYPDTIQNTQNSIARLIIRDVIAEGKSIEINAYQLPIIHRSLFQKSESGSYPFKRSLEETFADAVENLKKRIREILMPMVTRTPLIPAYPTPDCH